jgi:tetratricopeptide (TPR) repeat protein
MTLLQHHAKTPHHSPKPAPAQTAPYWHTRVEGLHVLKLSGSHYDMGRQHGELLKAEVRRGPMPYYRTYLERMLGRAGLGSVSHLAWPIIQRLVGHRVAGAFPDYAKDAIRGLADGADLDHGELLEGCSFPDAMVWVASRIMQLKRVGPAMHHRLALGLGCTSAVAWADATQDGKLLHARNFDYHGVACWPEQAAVVFHEPEDGLRYVSVSSAGVLMGGITAMNEAGLTLTVHQHMFTAETRLGGVPVGCVGDVIMREARSLDDAEAILRAHKPIGCWTYIITDGGRREVLAWEESPTRHTVVRRGGEGCTFGYSNIYLDRELGDTEKNLYGSYWRHNHARYERVNELLGERFGSLDANAMASILADQGTTSDAIGSAIAMVMTVGSVVFRPEDGVLWVGAGVAPTSHQPFVGFDLHGERHAPELGTLTGGVPPEGPRPQAYEFYRRAYVAYMDEDDAPGARALMQQAATLDDGQPLFHSLVGLLALQGGDAEAAFSSFGRALAIGHAHPERLAGMHLWRARAADLAGRREDALRDYRKSLGHHADVPVHEAARKGLRRSYAQKQARRVDIDFTYVDVVAP